MELWQLWCLIGLTFLIVEMFTPVIFFLNLGLACFVAALAGWLGVNFTIQVLVFAVFSALFLMFLRPFLVKTKNGKNNNEFEEKYKGKTALVTEKITEEGGRIAMYGETWQAKSINGQEIEKDSHVKIIRIDSIVMYVDAV